MSEKNPFENKQMIQLIWGVALVAMGLAFFFRISDVMGKISDIEHFTSVRTFIRIGFYLIGIILIGGGAKKIHAYVKRPDRSGD